MVTVELKHNGEQVLRATLEIMAVLVLMGNKEPLV
jgi:hypothetical protein